MGMTLKELLTKGEGTLSAQEAKDLAAQCRMDVETLYTLLEERGIKILDNEVEADTSLDVDSIIAEVENAENNSDDMGISEEEEESAEENPADLKAAMDELLDDPVKNYLKQIGQIPLLSAEQEVELSRRIHAGAEAAHILQADRQKYGAPEYIKKNSARFSFEEDENSRSYTEDLDDDGNEKSSEDAEEKAAEEEAMEAVENGPLTEEKRQELQVDVDDAEYAKKTAEEAGKSGKDGQLQKAQEKLKQCDDQIAALRAQLDAGRKEIEALRAPYANDPEFQKYEAYRDDGIDLARLEYNEMRRLRRDMQLIFQDPYSSLNPRMSVGQIISEGMQAHNMIKKKDARMQEMVLKIMDDCGLAPYFLHRFPHQFSGGQRQRIGIARALATKPKFVVCDEAVSALDVSIQAQIINLLLDLKEQQNLTYMFITHDLSVVKYISDRVGVMYLGNLVEYGAKEDIFRNPLHPYTKALFSAIPIPDPKVKMNRIVLEGSIPSPANPPKGCKFHTRCANCMACCKEEAPVQREIEPGHFVCCHLYDK